VFIPLQTCFSLATCCVDAEVFRWVSHPPAIAHTIPATATETSSLVCALCSPRVSDALEYCSRFMIYLVFMFFVDELSSSTIHEQGTTCELRIAALRFA
jgi:hypothetical protein